MSRGSRPRDGQHDHEGDEHLDDHPELVVQELPDFGPLRCCLVDDFGIRNKVYLDFCEGGNSMAYPWLAPKTVILAQAVSEAERPFVLLHEVREYNKMDREGWSYSRAHEYANAGEKAARDDPGKLQGLLDAELAILNSYRKPKFLPTAKISKLQT